MSDSDSLFNRLLQLSAFDGDSDAALRVMRSHFADQFADCSLALLLVRDQAGASCRLAGLIGADGIEQVPNRDPYNQHGELPLFDDALTAQVVSGSSAHAVALVPQWRDAPLAQALSVPATVLSVPIANSGILTHWLAFASTLEHRFDAVDVQRVLLHVNLAASLIVRPLALRELSRESARQRLEIESLADIQRLLLPDNPQIAGLEYAVHWQPAATAAGDYYELSNITPFAPEDFVPGCGDMWGLIVGDVSGHGAAAAMEAVQFDAILRTYRGDGNPPPASVITYANRYFLSRRSRGHFMTVFALLYRPDTRVLRYVSAGHPPLLLLRGGEVQQLGEADQIPLGVLRDYEYRNNDIALESQDVLILYTDGLIEARDRNGLMFGSDRMRSLALADPDNPRALCDSIVAAVQAHQGGPLGTDDQTLIVLKIAH